MPMSTHLVTQIMTDLRFRYRALNEIHYEAAWSDSRAYTRCFHEHPTLIEAAKCGMPQPGFYVLAIELGKERQLTAAEDGVVNAFRFAKHS
jgi:hypothetical protein